MPANSLVAAVHCWNVKQKHEQKGRHKFVAGMCYRADGLHIGMKSGTWMSAWSVQETLVPSTAACNQQNHTQLGAENASPVIHAPCYHAPYQNHLSCSIPKSTRRQLWLTTAANVPIMLRHRYRVPYHRCQLKTQSWTVRCVTKKYLKGQMSFHQLIFCNNSSK